MALDKKDFIVGVLDKYPEELLDNRINIESCVIACLWKDVLLIDDSNLSPKDFVTVDGRYYYSLASHLRKAGLNVLDEVAVTASITEEMSDAWEERGGWKTIENVVDVVDLNNYAKYLEDLYKGNIILGLHRDGFNLMTEIEEKGKKYRPIDLFKRLSSEQIVDWYESRLTKAGTGYSSRILEEEEIDFDDDFLDDCSDGNAEGTHFDYAGVDEVDGKPVSCLPFLSRQISGLPSSGSSVIAAYSGVGKSTLIIPILIGLMYYGKKILIISNEEKVKRFKIKFLVWIIYKYFKYYNITRKKILTGDLTDEDRKYMKKAQQYWREHFKGKIKFVGIPDSDMSLVKKISRENILRYGYDTIFYDTMKYSFDDTQTKEYLALIKDSRELDEIAKKYDITMLYSVQLSISTIGKLFLDSSCLSLSKQIKEVLENLFLMRNVYPEELDPKSKFYCHPFRLEQENGKWTEKEFHADPTATWKVLFVDKTRDGETSNDNGKAYLLRFDGAHSIFIEKAMCRPVHGYIQ